MLRDLKKFLKTIATALDAAFGRAIEQEHTEGEKIFDIQRDRLIVFSDLHKGNRDGADDFGVCEQAYNAALAYYDRLGYTLIVLGDVEELWEEWPQTVLKAYPHTLELEALFHRAERYLRFWGNHDDAWSHPDVVKNLLMPVLGGLPLKVRESLILHARDGEHELGRLFLIHGHQGTLDSDRIAPVSKFLLRYFWRPFQRITKISMNTPSRDYELRYEHDTAMYFWSQAQEKLVLIAGHTHRPVFKSESHEEIARKALKALEDQLAQRPRDSRLLQEVAEKAAELEWTHTKQLRTPMPLMELKKPSYFNSGCCCFRDGDITGLELSEGEIRLVRWPDDQDEPRPKILAQAKLQDVFADCQS